MKLSARSLVKFSIFIIVYTGFGGTLYFLNGRLQELGLLFLIITFSYVALISALNVRAADLKWSWWTFATIIFISYTMMVPAFTFSSNTGTSPVPSMFSTRDFFAALFAGVLYFSYRSGISPQELENSICLALGAIVLSYVFHYYRIDLEEAYRSPIAAVKGMITYDEWRGYRLKGPNLAHTFCTLVSPVLIVREKQTIYRLFWILVFLASAWAWYLIQARALFAALILGLIKSNELGITNLLIKGDSKLVINQVTGEFNVKSDNLINLYIFIYIYIMTLRLPNNFINAYNNVNNEKSRTFIIYTTSRLETLINIKFSDWSISSFLTGSPPFFCKSLSHLPRKSLFLAHSAFKPSIAPGSAPSSCAISSLACDNPRSPLH
mgnify:CR=1 FL=1